MCLAVPVQIVSILGARATVHFSGNEREADISLVGNVRTGDWVLLHAGFAIQKITQEEAQETLILLGQIEGQDNFDK